MMILFFWLYLLLGFVIWTTVLGNYKIALVVSSGRAVLFFRLPALYFFAVLLSLSEQLENIVLFDGTFLISFGHELVDGWMRVDEYLDLVLILDMLQFMYILCFQGLVLYYQLLHFDELAVVIVGYIDELVVFIVMEDVLGRCGVVWEAFVFVFGELVDEGVAFLVGCVVVIGGLGVEWLHDAF